MEPEKHSRFYNLANFLKDRFLNAILTFSAAIVSKPGTSGFGRKGLLFAGMVLGAIAASCSSPAPNPDAGQTDQSQEIVVSENVHVIPDDQAAQARLLGDDVVFPADGNEDLITLDKEDIIVSGYERGFLREVRGVEETDDEIILRTKQATLEQVFEKAHFEYTISIKQEEQPASPVTSYALLPERPEDEIDSSFFWDFSGTVLCDGESSKCGLPLYVEIEHGRVEFAPHLEAEIVITDNQLDYFRFEAGGDFAASIELEAKPERQLKAEFKEEIKIGEYWTVFWTPSVPPIPIVNGTVGYLVPGFEIDAGAEVSFGAGAKSSLRVGAEYDSGKWETINEFSFDYSSYGPSLDFEVGVEAKAYIYPTYYFNLYGVAGPYLYMGPNAYLDLEVFPDCEWELGAGAYGEIGVQVNVLGETIAGYGETLFNERVPITEGVCWEGDSALDTDYNLDTGTWDELDTENWDSGDAGTVLDAGIPQDTDTDSENDSEGDSESAVTVDLPGTLAWAKHVGSEGWDYPEDIAVFEDGSFTLIGVVRGKNDWESISFGEDEQNRMDLPYVGGQSGDFFIARYDKEGSLSWARSAGSADGDDARGVLALPDGSSVVVGEFTRSPVIFGRGESDEISLSTEKESDYVSFATGPGLGSFIAKYSQDGTLLWAEANEADWCEDVSFLSDGSFVMVGNFRGPETVFGEGMPNETILAETDGSIFIARYSSDGEFLWVKSAGMGGGELTGRSLYDKVNAVDSVSGDSVVLAGHSTAGVLFAKGESNETMTRRIDGLFIAEYSADGTFGGVKLFDDAYPHDMGVSSDGSILLVGDQSRLGDTPFISKYVSGDTFSWLNSVSGEGEGVASDLAVFQDGSSAVIGTFEGSATFGEGEANETTLDTGEDAGTFVARYTQSGSLLWVTMEGNPAYDFGNALEALPDGSLLLTGTFTGRVVFGKGTQNETILEAPEDREDIFIVKYY